MTSIEGVAKTINLIIAPVVLITACALTVNGLVVRYGSIGDRIRSVTQEINRLQDIAISEDHLKTQRLQNLDFLLNDLLWHHHFVHDAILLMYIAILTFMLNMLVIAVAVATNLIWLSQVALIVFLGGVAILFGGTVLITYETRTSHHAIQFEVHHNCSVCQQRHMRAGNHLLKK